MAEHAWVKNYPSGVDWDFEFQPTTIQNMMDEAADSDGDATFIDFFGVLFTFGELRDLADRAAKGFQDLGVGPGTHVGLFLPNVPQYVVAMFGVLKAGGTVVNYSPLMAEQEMQYQIDDSETDILVTLDVEPMFPLLSKVLPGSRLKKVVIGNITEALSPGMKAEAGEGLPEDGKHMTFQALIDNDGKFKAHDPGDLADAVAMLQYTGGTTGKPKGAMLTHACITAASAIYGEWNKQDEDPPREGQDKVLLVLPLFHIFGLSVVMLGCLRDRAQIILHPRPDIDAIIKDIGEKKPTILPGVPTLFTAIANHPEAPNTDFSSLIYCGSGGAPLPVEVQQKFEKVTGVRVREGYGLTETSPAATANPREETGKVGTCGLPLPGTEIEIRGIEDAGKIMKPGEIGEVCIKGPQLMKGYWQRPEETAEALRDGWLHTGDTGYLDEDGYLFLVDRLKDLIISSGYNVYPRHIEEAIHQHPSVEEVTVIGIPDEYRGEAAKAFVKLVAGGKLSLEELIEFLGDKLGKYEMPAELEIRDELPKTAVGKLSKKELVAEEKAKREKQAKAG